MSPTDDYDLERAVLGGLLQLGEDRPPPWASHVTAEYYEPKNHQAIQAAISTLIAENEPVDVVTVSDLLRSSGANLSAYVAEIAHAAAGTSTLEYHARRMVERRQWRVGRRRLLEIAEAEAIPDTRGLLDVIDEVRDVARCLEPAIIKGGPVPIRDVLQEVIAGLIRDLDPTNPGRAIKTGLQELDETLAMCPGELTAMGARPSQGKTATSLAITRGASRDLSRGAVAVFSIEMTTDSLVRRLLQSEAAVTKRGLPEAAKAGTLNPYAANIHNAEIWIDERADLSVADMRLALTKVPAGVQLVVVDYLQLVRHPSRSSDVDAIGESCKQLKQMAKEFSCHVLLLTQLNRQVEQRPSKQPQLSDLRGSGNIEEHSDNVVLLFRPGYYFADADKTELQLDIAKQRNGPVRGVRARWNGPTQRITDWKE